jgi:hypothetical protein
LSSLWIRKSCHESRQAVLHDFPKHKENPFFQLTTSRYQVPIAKTGGSHQSIRMLLFLHNISVEKYE